MKHLATFLSAALLVLAAGAALCAEAQPEGYWISVLRKADAVQLSVADGVSGGCWLNPSATKAAIEATLLKAGIPVVPGAAMRVRLSAIGVAITAEGGRTGCAAHIEIEAQHVGAASAPNGGLLVSALITSYRRGAFAVGPRNLDEQLTRTATQWASEFAALWRKAHQESR